MKSSQKLQLTLENKGQSNKKNGIIKIIITISIIILKK